MPYIYDEGYGSRHMDDNTIRDLKAYAMAKERENRWQAMQANEMPNRWGMTHSRNHSNGSGSTDESLEDFAMKTRISSMVFNGRPYPPIPPDASTLPKPPKDDWSDVPPVHMQASAPTQPHVSQAYGAHGVGLPYLLPAVRPNGQYDTGRGFVPGPPSHDLFNHGYIGQPQALAYSPSCAYPGAPPLPYRAPVLHPRMVHLPEQPPSPHDTYKYPISHIDQIVIAQDPAPLPQDVVNPSLSYWYAEQVLEILVKPGQFRPGVGGSADSEWGPDARERDAWLRVGRKLPGFTDSWGRMGMKTTTPVLRKARPRNPDMEVNDPWDVLWQNSPRISDDLIFFVSEVIQRMSITPTAVVSAVWFIRGLGLHEGDPGKGAELRAMLKEAQYQELEGVIRRVIVLGLILAGKWLDDNSFLTKSWTEVTGIDTLELDRLERFALQDLCYSLYIPTSAWADHVNKLYASIECKGSVATQTDLIMIGLLDQMVHEARSAEIADPLEQQQQAWSSSPPSFERRVSYEAASAAADQLFNRSWDMLCDTLPAPAERPGYNTGDVEMERAERDVSALVDDDGDGDEDEDEDEFLEYDGADRFLPSLSELKRSSSNSSGTGSSNKQVLQSQPIQARAWQSTVKLIDPSNPEIALPPLPPLSRPSLAPSWDQPASLTSSGSTSPVILASDQKEKHFSCRASRCRDIKTEANPPALPVRSNDIASQMSSQSSKSSKGYKDTGVILEPGISIVRPPTGHSTLPAYSSLNVHPDKSQLGRGYDEFGFLLPALSGPKYASTLGACREKDIGYYSSNQGWVSPLW